jgi:pyruvate,water dikinase
MLKELGRRMVQAGAIARPDDVFWLTEKEVEEASAALDRSEGLAAMATSVRQRQAEWRAQKRLSPPPTLPPMKRFFVGSLNMGGLSTARGRIQAGDTLKGIAAGPEDFDQMRAGLILVAEITTPAWTPLFAMAAGVVTDVGGPQSHGSIVAREYGIPAVMGTGVATRRVHGGQVITVDGDAGTVKLTPPDVAIAP